MYVCSQSRLGTGGVQSFTLIVKPNGMEEMGVRSSKESVYFANNREVSISVKNITSSIRPINMDGAFSSYGIKGKLLNIYYSRVITRCSNQPFSLCKLYQFCGSMINTAMSRISNFTPSRIYSSDLELTDDTTMAQVNLGDVVITLATTWSIIEESI